MVIQGGQMFSLGFHLYKHSGKLTFEGIFDTTWFCSHKSGKNENSQIQTIF